MKARVGDLPKKTMFITTLTHKTGSIRAVDQPTVGVPVWLGGEKKTLHPDVVVAVIGTVEGVER